MLARRTLALAFAAFLAVAGAMHGHLPAPAGAESCSACVLHAAAGAAPALIALPVPTPAATPLEIPAAAPLRSRAVESFCFETGPPRAA